jgi:hypothetical protein
MIGAQQCAHSVQTPLQCATFCSDTLHLLRLLTLNWPLVRCYKRSGLRAD